MGGRESHAVMPLLIMSFSLSDHYNFLLPVSVDLIFFQARRLLAAWVKNRNCYSSRASPRLLGAWAAWQMLPFHLKAADMPGSATSVPQGKEGGSEWKKKCGRGYCNSNIVAQASPNYVWIKCLLYGADRSVGEPLHVASAHPQMKLTSCFHLVSHQQALRLDFMFDSDQRQHGEAPWRNGQLRLCLG